MRFAVKSGECRSEPLPASAENFPYWEVRVQVSPPLLRGDPVANKRSCANFPPSNRSCGILRKKNCEAPRQKHTGIRQKDALLKPPKVGVRPTCQKLDVFGTRASGQTGGGCRERRGWSGLGFFLRIFSKTANKKLRTGNQFRSKKVGSRPKKWEP